MKLIVTGGSGFIGSAVCRHCINDLGWKVVNVDALTYAATAGSLASISTHDDYKFYHANILDRAALDEILNAEKPDAIMHLAAESHVDRSIDGPMAFVETNVLGTVVLLESTRRYLTTIDPASASRFRFLHVSTDEVFGSLELTDTAFSEITPYQPSSPYSASKAASDHFARAYGETYKLPVMVSNCSNNYGMYHFPEKLIPLMIIKALNYQPLPVYGAGTNVRDWLYVEDHARALASILQKGRVGQSYNIGGNAERTNLSVVTEICDILDRKRPEPNKPSRRSLITFVKDRPGHDLRYAIDPEKIQTEIGWTPQVKFEDGIERTIDWFLNNQDWWQPLLDGKANPVQRLGHA